MLPEAEIRTRPRSFSAEQHRNEVQRARVVHGLQNSPDSCTFATRMTTARISATQCTELLRDPSVYALAANMLQSPESHRNPLGLLFSMLSVDDLPPDLQDRFSPSRLDVSLQTSPEDWLLCPDAETRFDKSTRRGSNVVGLHGETSAFLVKMHGKMTALCLEEVVTEDGNVFFPGNWYSPVENETRNAFREAFIAGEERIPLPVEGRWKYMRPFALGGDETIASVLSMARANADRNYIPHEFVLGNATYTREEYLRFVSNVVE